MFRLFVNQDALKAQMAHKQETIKKGSYIIFKTGENTSESLETGDILQGMFLNANGVEVFSSARYLGGDVLDNASYQLFETQS